MPIDSSGNYWIARDASGTYSADYYMELARDNAVIATSYNNAVNLFFGDLQNPISLGSTYYSANGTFIQLDQYANHSGNTQSAINSLATTKMNEFITIANKFKNLSDPYANTNVIDVETVMTTFQGGYNSNSILSPYYLISKNSGTSGLPFTGGLTNDDFLSNATDVMDTFLPPGIYYSDIITFINKARGLKEAFNAFKNEIEAENGQADGMGIAYSGLAGDSIAQQYYDFYSNIINNKLSFDSSNNLIIPQRNSLGNIILPDFPTEVIQGIYSSVNIAKLIIESRPQAPPPPTFVSQITDSSGITRIKFRGDTTQVPQAPFIQARFVYDSSGILPNYSIDSPGSNSTYTFVDIGSPAYVADTTKIFDSNADFIGINTGVSVDSSGICFAEFAFANPITSPDAYTISWYLTNSTATSNSANAGFQSAPASFTLTPTGSAPPSVPGKPNAPTLVSATQTTLTIRTNAIGISGSPFTEIDFFARDSSGNLSAAANPSNNRDSSNNRLADSSGNYTGTITGLTSGKPYSVRVMFSNTYGSSILSDPLTVSTTTPFNVASLIALAVADTNTASTRFSAIYDYIDFTLINSDPSPVELEDNGSDIAVYAIDINANVNNLRGYYTSILNTIGNYYQSLQNNTTVSGLLLGTLGGTTTFTSLPYIDPGQGGTLPTAADYADLVTVKTLLDTYISNISTAYTNYFDKSDVLELQAGYLNTAINENVNGASQSDIQNATAYYNDINTLRSRLAGLAASPVTELSKVSRDLSQAITLLITPQNPAILVNSTTSTITVSYDTAGDEVSPTGGVFRILDSSSNVLNTVSATGTQDASGNILPDASGNYTGTFTDLSEGLTYYISFSYTVTSPSGEIVNGEPGPLSEFTIGPVVPGTPPEPTIISVTPNSVTLRLNTNGISGSPFTGYIFRTLDFIYITTDSSGVENVDSSGIYYDTSGNVSPDSSGNYTATITGLSSTTFYRVRALLKNSDGTSEPGGAIKLSTLGTPGTPPTPILGASDYNSLTIAISLENTLGGYFNTTRFTITDSSGYSYYQNAFPSALNSGYFGNIIGLPPSKTYQISFTISNSFGTRTSASLTASTTSIPAYNPNIDTLASQAISALNNYSNIIGQISGTLFPYSSFANSLSSGFDISSSVTGPDNTITHSAEVISAFQDLKANISNSSDTFNTMTTNIQTVYYPAIAEFTNDLEGSFLRSNTILDPNASNYNGLYFTHLQSVIDANSYFAPEYTSVANKISTWSLTALQTALANTDSAWNTANGGPDTQLAAWISSISSILTNSPFPTTNPINTSTISTILSSFNNNGTALSYIIAEPRKPSIPSLVSITTNGTIISLKVSGNRNSILEGYFSNIYFNLTTLTGTSYANNAIVIPDSGISPDSSGNIISTFTFSPGTSVFNVGDLVTITWGATNIYNGTDASGNAVYNTSDPLFVVLRPPQPSKASGDSTLDAPTLVSATSSSLTLRNNVNGIRGKPLSDVYFTASDSSGNVRRATTSNTQDASGNYITDASGNYTGTITGLSVSRAYSVRTTLNNGNSPSTSAPFSASTTSGPPPGTPNAPTLVSKTLTSLTVRSSTTGVSGSPFTGYLFRATDSSNNTFDSSDNASPDASGNYTATIGDLASGRAYSVTATLYNTSGNTTSTGTSITTGSVPGPPNAPTLVSATSTSLTVRSSGVSGGPFNFVDFIITDSSENTAFGNTINEIDGSGNYVADASGNYVGTFSGLTPNSSYRINVEYSNQYGVSTSALLTVSTLQVPGSPPAPKLVSATPNSVTLRVNTNGISGGPFTGYIFRASDSSGNNYDSSGNVAPDASGNYTATITGLSSTRLYNAYAILKNSIGNSSNGNVITVSGLGTPGTPPVPILIASDFNSLLVSVNLQGVLGGYFDTTKFTITDSSGYSYLQNATVNYDNAFIYRTNFIGLPPSKTYQISITISNSFGTMTSASLTASTTSIPTYSPNIDTIVSQTIATLNGYSTSLDQINSIASAYYNVSYNNASYYSIAYNVAIDGTTTHSQAVIGAVNSLILSVGSTLQYIIDIGDAIVAFKQAINTFISSLNYLGSQNLNESTGSYYQNIESLYLMNSTFPGYFNGLQYSISNWSYITTLQQAVANDTAWNTANGGNPDSQLDGFINDVSVALMNSFPSTNPIDTSTITTSFDIGGVAHSYIIAQPRKPSIPSLVSITTDGTNILLKVRGNRNSILEGYFSVVYFNLTTSGGSSYASVNTLQNSSLTGDSSGTFIETFTFIPDLSVYNTGELVSITWGATNVNNNQDASGNIPYNASDPLLVVLRPPQPSTPNAPTLVSATSSSLTLSNNATGITGKPLSDVNFTAFDSSGNVIRANASNSQDASGNYVADSSGNYTATITGLSASRAYSLRTTLNNGFSPSTSEPFTASTSSGVPGTPNAPTQVSVTSTSITVRSSTTGVSDSPFNAYRFRATDSSNNTFDSSGNGPPDASGNYIATIGGLTSGRVYSVTITLFNQFGNTTSSGTSITAGAGSPPGTPPAPTLVSATSATLSLRANATGVSGAPFNNVSFTATDSSGSVSQAVSDNNVDASGNYLPDASGNYLGVVNVESDSSGILRDIFRNTNYSVRVIFSNIYGSTTSSSLSATTTINQVQLGRGGLHINASRYLYAFISLYRTGGSPFTSCDFNFTDSNNKTTVYRYIGEELIGGKGNYFALITTNNRRISGTPILANTTYNVNATLYNSAGSVSGTDYLSITTLLENVQAVLISKTSSSIVVSGDLGKLTDGSRLDVNKAITDVLINYMDGSGNNFLDASGNPLNTSVSGPDASGNYTGTMTGLTGNTQYSIYFSYFYDENLYSSVPFNVTTNSAGPPPGTPNAPILVSKTATSLTVFSNVNGISGGPFNGVSFTATDSSGNTISQNTSNNQDASGNYIADSSGNYLSTIGSLVSNKTYIITAKLINIYGNATSVGTSITTGGVPGTPNAPTLVSATGTTITLRNSVSGVSGGPFTECIFNLYSPSVFVDNFLSTSTVDSSGNYNVTFTNLSYSATFLASVSLINATGSSVFSSTITVSTPAQPPPGQANRPVLVESVDLYTIIVSTNTTGVSGEPFTEVEFIFRDSSNNILKSQGLSDYPDSSGNYTITTGPTLSPTTVYYISARLTNGGGTGLPSSPLLVLTKGPPLAPPSPIFISKLATSITVYASTVGVLGSPFIGGVFKAVDSGNTTFTANPSNLRDSSGNYLVDSSGNYTATITGLTQNTAYTLTFALANIDGLGPDSDPVNISTGELPGNPNPPSEISVTTTSITVRTSTNGVIGGPFTGYRFRATDPNNILFNGIGTMAPDSSGNYNRTISGLNSSTTYNVTVTLFNQYGASNASNFIPITTSTAVGPPPGTASPPTLVSKTATSITMSSNPNGISGDPFSGGLFTVKDTSGTTVTTANPTIVDASGNYSAILSGLTQGTSYNVTFALSNSTGNGPTSSATSVTTGILPGTPNAATQVSVTTNSITVRTSTTGISGDPFTAYRFRATDTSNNTFDSSGNGAPDASGNYNDTISGLSPGRTYTVSVTLFNEYGNTTGPGTSMTTGSVPGTPNAPTQVSVTTNSITVRTSTNGISGSPFTAYRFRATDTSNNTFDSSGNGAPDASGNYNDTISGLTSGRAYTVTASLFNAFGNTTSTGTSMTTGSVPGTPNAPTQISVTTTSITVRTSTTGVSSGPFTAYRFRATDTSNNTFDSSGNGAPDASGNYNDTISGLNSSTLYNVTTTLFNAFGNTTSSTTAITTSTAVAPLPGTANAPTLVSKTATSIIMTSSPSGVSGSPFTGGLFTVKTTGGTTVTTANPSTVDASGNYTSTLSGLTQGTSYNVTFALSNSSGNGPTSSATSVTTEAIPGTPNAPTQISVTTTSITVRTSTTGVSSGPFTAYRFRATDTSNNTFDSSGNGAPDASGNYNDTISGLTPGRTYTVTATLFNAFGNTTSTGTSITTGSLPGTPNAPTQVSVTTTSITVRTSTTGVSGGPFTAYRFRATDTSNNTFDSSGNGAPDASGNYNDTISGLTSGRTYTVTATLFNTFGNTTSTGTSMTTGSLPGTANAPTQISVTTTSITVRTSTTGITGTPFNAYRFRATDTSNNTFDSSGNGAPDASGNYNATISGLNSSRSYNVTATLFNVYGAGNTSSATSITTSAAGGPPGTPNAPILISKTTTSITVRNSTSGVTGGPFTAYRFRATDSNNNTFDSSGNGAPDTSGNYNGTISGLSAGTAYTVTATLFNTSGNTTGPGTSITTGSTPAIPNAPTLVKNGSTSITIRNNPNTLGSPFTRCDFNLTDNNSNTLTYTVYGAPDSSGFYTLTTPGIELTPLTTYNVFAKLYNEFGNTTSQASLTVTTLAESSQPILVSTSTNSIIVVSNLSTDTNGSPITKPYTNVIINYEKVTLFSMFSTFASNATSGTGTVTGPDSSGNYTGTITGLSSSSNYSVYFSFSNSSGNYTTQPLNVSTTSNGICFKTGSKILCLKDNREQYVPVEELRRGDLVKTLSGEYIKINLIGRSTINNPDNSDRGPNRLFILRQANYPELNEDLIITGCHSRLVDRLTEQQKKRHLQLMSNLYITTGKFRLMAFIDEKAEPYRDPGVHEIWHFALDNANEVCNYGVYANGLLVETASIKNMGKIAGINLL